MGARKDAVKINGKQYLQIDQSVAIDLDGSIDGVIGQLQELRDQYGGQAYISISAETEVDPWTDWCSADVEQTLHYTRIETDEERNKRLEANRKRRETRKQREKERKEEQHDRELKQLQRLAEKHGKQVI